MAAPKVDLSPSSSFVNLDHTTSATEAMVALAKPLAEGTIPETVRTNEIVQAIMNAGIHTLSAGEDPWNKLKKMGGNFTTKGGVNALLMPPVDIGNGFVARTHVMGNEVTISPKDKPEQLFMRRFKETPKIEDLGQRKFRISGTTIDGKTSVDEVALAA